jgi:hypothetical protein
VEVDPSRPKLKAPGTKRLKLKYDGPLSNSAFKFKLRRFNKACCCAQVLCGALERARAAGYTGTVVLGRGLHSFPFQLNLSPSVYCIAQLNS